ncbi:MAG: alkaline phosphatase [Sedimentisphaerales bacterium]|nr:alkaline phosphatase [Sedimentisphaerales bacterium]
MRSYIGRLRKMIYVLAIVALVLSGPADGQSAGPRAKNVIVMISDGCGYNHVDAATIYQYGKTGVQPYEQFPVKLAMSTYLDGQSYEPEKAWSDFKYVSKSKSFTDSAAAATTMSAGVKTKNGYIGLAPDKTPLKHTVQLAEERGKATGVVTSVQFSHATPAGFVAHNKSRDNYDEIAREMIYKSPLEVIMGCGHPEYDNDGDPVKVIMEYKYVGGKDAWEDLKDGSVTGADSDGDGAPDKWTVIHEPGEFRKLMSGPTPKRVIAIPKKKKTLQQERGGKGKAAPFEVPFNGDVPTLAEMAAGALNVLDNDPDGFFLMIEGGAIDWASHDNQPGRVIEEQIEFNKAVEAVIKWIETESSWQETLLIITADHECGYLTGPDSGTIDGKGVWNPIKNNGKGNPPKMEYHSTDHTNSLIPFYAKGAGSQLFVQQARNTDPVRGPYLDNTSIAKVVFSLLGN